MILTNPEEKIPHELSREKILIGLIEKQINRLETLAQTQNDEDKIKTNETITILKEQLTKAKNDKSIIYIKSPTVETYTKMLNCIKKIYDHKNEQTLIYENRGDQMKIALEGCLVGWENVKNSKGEVVLFPENDIKKAINLLPPVDRLDLFSAIETIAYPSIDFLAV